MVDAIVAIWHGGNYQSRIFWQHAIDLLLKNTHVSEVTFEANGPKSFDDVIVRYHPPIHNPTGPESISVDYFQIKFHMDVAGRFGYEDLIKPDFIGATSISLLQRLQDAKKNAPKDARFNIITTYKILDNDPLSEIINGVDHSIALNKLFDKTTTDKSRMGKVRKLWRDHLNLKNNDELKEVIKGLRINAGYLNLEELRNRVNEKATYAGLITCNNSQIDFRYDELAKQLKATDLNNLTKEHFRNLCRTNGLYAQPISTDEDKFTSIAISSFISTVSDFYEVPQKNRLLLTQFFHDRYLIQSKSWQNDIFPIIQDFLTEQKKLYQNIRLFLEAHASIAFLAGKFLDLKSGIKVELIQKGRVGSKKWVANDGSVGDTLEVEMKDFDSTKSELALVISIARNAVVQTENYIKQNDLNIGKILCFTPKDGPSQQFITGGEHAAILADQIANKIAIIRSDLDQPLHIFAACPNTLMFFLGQQHQALAPCVVYEFDFDRQGNKSYYHSFKIN